MLGITNAGFTLATFLDNAVTAIQGYGSMIVLVLGVLCFIAGVVFALLKLFAKQGQFSQKFSWVAVVIMIVVGAVVAIVGGGKALSSLANGTGETFKGMGTDESYNADGTKDNSNNNPFNTVLPGMDWYTIPENPQLSDFM